MFRLNFRNKPNTWPAFVDLFSNLVIILIFLLIIFVFLWTTTSVFNKKAGVRTIADLKQMNAEQTAQIKQMNADNEEAMRLLIQARAELLSNQDEIDSQNLSMIDIINAYENEVSKVKASDDAARREVSALREQLEQTIAVKEQLAELEQQRRELQEQMQKQVDVQQELIALQESEMTAQQNQIATQLEKMTAQETEMAKYTAELQRLNAALGVADQELLAQQVKYIEMSNNLNKALADKVAELQDMREYQSEFYRAVKIALGDTESVEADGDRFIVQSDILFPTGSYKLSAAGKKQLHAIADVIKEMETKIPSDIDWIIRVDGHTDNKPVVAGNRAYSNNMQLSLLRATAVVNELVHDGVLKKRLVPSGFGDMYPFAPNTDATNMQKNRRIELKLTNK
ncbi:MAG: OmpA family protein [Alphaproteobacteria bacterium]|nr:OmpA family protein [Alphaproteobacteria bacterium]